MAAKMKAKVSKVKTISRRELAMLAFTNSKRLPKIVNFEGRQKRWVGIGWVDEGAATGDEVKVVE
jgi:hypothetical protein